VIEARNNSNGKTDYFGITTIIIGVGLLQYVLDKGQELDWLDSNIIRITGAVAVLAIIAMIWREWTHSSPVIQLRLLKNRNFASSVLSNFTLGVVLNGSTILIPQFLQLQLGYSAERAGLALSPSGVTLALLMPVAGILGSRFDPRKVIAVGFLLTSASMFWMMRLTPDIDFGAVVWMRVFQVVGLPLIFIPISTLAYVGMRREDNNQVSGISNFVRNLGGAIGVSFLVSYMAISFSIAIFRLCSRQPFAAAAAPPNLAITHWRSYSRWSTHRPMCSRSLAHSSCWVLLLPCSFLFRS
jgi:DHA2 family multidrug resistance protein